VSTDGVHPESDRQSLAPATSEAQMAPHVALDLPTMQELSAVTSARGASESGAPGLPDIPVDLLAVPPVVRRSPNPDFGQR
jgi:hypothetical protein